MAPGLGVLAHITSIPGGTLGAPARAFVDWLARVGARYWQVLPLNPVDEFGSPYAGISAFAGNVALLEGNACNAANNDPREFQSFCERNRDWLEPYAAFTALGEKLGMAWQNWPKELHRFDPDAISADPDLQAAVDRCRRSQFAVDREWHELRGYANERDVSIIGDIPLYVNASSTDTWTHPEIFQLGPDGRPQVVAGCPPDDFAANGQIWNNPVYDWNALHMSGFPWWLRRLERAFELFDFVRLDHFIGFSRYYSIPVGEPAANGEWRPGPGIDFFRKARDVLGPLPVIAEDLGDVTPEVRELVAACGFPGMNVIQFADDPLAGWSAEPGAIAYTGTHDNQTLIGYAQSRYPGLDPREVAGALMQTVAASAPVAIFPLQDLLGLGDEARMNTPGTTTGNWTWQATAEQLKQFAI